MKRVLDATAPPTRLAAFRVVVGVFVLVYLVVRLPVFLALADRPDEDFDGVGVLAPLSSPPSGGVLTAVMIVALATGLAATLGWRFRPNAIAFAGAVLFLTTLRGSWGQLLHFENLMVLQLLVLAASPAAEAWSLDAKRTDPENRPDTDEHSIRYGWPLSVMALITVVTYVITGVAKLRYGGLDWVSGDTLRNHIAYSAARLDLIGGTPPVLAEIAVRWEWVLAAGAFGTVAIELFAPVAMIGPRFRNVWVVAAWLMHLGILLTMAIGFPSPLFGVAFAPFFALERVVPFVKERVRRWWPQRSGS